MSPQREIQAKDLLRDVREGLPPSRLMVKYQLSYKGLKQALDKLIGAGPSARTGFPERAPDFLTVSF